MSIAFERPLVTGATGHLGNVLVRELLSRGKQVRALVLEGESLAPLEGLEVEKVKGDLLAPATLDAAMAGRDVVFHVAGMVAVGGGTRDALWRTNVIGTRNVVQAALRARVRRLVYTSSVHAFVEPASGGVLDERQAFDPARSFGDYGRSKAAASLEVLAGCRQGLDAVLVCPTGVIGPYDFRPSEVGAMILALADGRLGGAIEGGYDFVDVRDVAAGQILACDTGRAGEAYLLTAGRITVPRMLEELAALIGRRAPKLVLPRWLALPLSHVAQLLDRLRGERPRLTPYVVHTLGIDFEISDHKARAELGFSSRPIVESLRDAWKWLEANRR